MTRDLSSSRHAGVMALFNRHFIKQGVLPVDMGRFYSRAFDHRLTSDYGDIVELEEPEVKADLARAEEFIAEIRSKLKQ